MRLMLIGCSKLKTYDRKNTLRGGRVFPGQFYSSQLFVLRKVYSELSGCEWAVLSARLGLWRSDQDRNPTDAGVPYSLKLSELQPADRAHWVCTVARDVTEYLSEPFHTGGEHLKPHQLQVEIHAGQQYAEPLGAVLRALGIATKCPVAGLGIGQQLAWYTRQIEELKSPAGGGIVLTEGTR